MEGGVVALHARLDFEGTGDVLDKKQKAGPKSVVQ